MITAVTSVLEDFPVISKGIVTNTFDIDLSLPAKRFEFYYNDSLGLEARWWSMQVFDGNSHNICN